MFKFIKLIGSVLVCVALVSDCSKKGDHQAAPPVSPTQPTITSFIITDFCLKKVTIVGTGFNPDITKDSVTFGFVRGIIDSVNSTKIFARAPSGNISGYIKVYCNGLMAFSTRIFNIGDCPRNVVYVAGNSGYCYAIDISSATIL